MFNSNDGGKHQYALMDGAMNFNRFGLKGNEGLAGAQRFVSMSSPRRFG
ncbi:hypothetical protein OKW34_002949 [Paraburkholderia youngii]